MDGLLSAGRWPGLAGIKTNSAQAGAGTGAELGKKAFFQMYGMRGMAALSKDLYLKNENLCIRVAEYLKWYMNQLSKF